MNLKTQSKKLEVLFEQEVKHELPVALMPDGSLIFKDFKIKQNKKKTWDITRVNGFKIDTFNLKACALMAARLYNINRLVTYNEIKLLDQQYQNNLNDSEIFKHRYITTTDSDKKDLFLWRWEITKNRASLAKQQITSKFRSMF